MLTRWIVGFFFLKIQLYSFFLIIIYFLYIGKKVLLSYPYLIKKKEWVID